MTIEPEPRRSRGLSGGVARGGGGRTDSLADILERVLDAGIVVAGDIVVQILDIELITLKVRLIIASAETAQQMGIDWWKRDPFLNSQASDLQQRNKELEQRVADLERRIESANVEVEELE